MNKPNNYETTQAAGEFTPIELGGHYLTIKQVKETMSSKNRPMVVVYFDTTDNDKQPHYFADSFRNDIRPEKKWPAGGTAYITSEDQNGNCSKSFKGFCSAVENSNPGFKIQWGAGFCDCLKNRLVGGIFAEELSIYNDKVSKQHKIKWFCKNEKVADAKIPDPVETKEYKEFMSSGRTGGTPAPGTPDFMNIPDNMADELPFM